MREDDLRTAALIAASVAEERIPHAWTSGNLAEAMRLARLAANLRAAAEPVGPDPMGPPTIT